MNLHGLFAIAAQRAPDKVALHFSADSASASSDSPRNWATLTYRELHATADHLAAGLHKWGLRKGDRVAFFLGNRPEFVIAYLAVIKLGAIMVPVNLRYRRLEIGHIFSDCEPRLVVTESAEAPFLEDAGYGAAGEVAWLLVEEMEAWASSEA